MSLGMLSYSRYTESTFPDKKSIAIRHYSLIWPAAFFSCDRTVKNPKTLRLTRDFPGLLCSEFSSLRSSKQPPMSRPRLSKIRLFNGYPFPRNCKRLHLDRHKPLEFLNGFLAYSFRFRFSDLYRMCFLHTIENILDTTPAFASQDDFR